MISQILLYTNIFHFLGNLNVSFFSFSCNVFDLTNSLLFVLRVHVDSIYKPIRCCLAKISILIMFESSIKRDYVNPSAHRTAALHDCSQQHSRLPKSLGSESATGTVSKRF